jgi:hypothetical protein
MEATSLEHVLQCEKRSFAHPHCAAGNALPLNRQHQNGTPSNFSGTVSFFEKTQS